VVETAGCRDPGKIDHRSSQHSILEVDETQPPVVEDIQRHRGIVADDDVRISVAILPRECTELPGEPPMPLVEMLLGARAREVLRCEALGIERTDRDPETMETFEQRGGPPDAFWALQRTGVDRPRAAQMLRDEHACGFVARDDARRDLERGGLGGDPRFVDEIERARAIRAREANHPLMLAARGKERASSQASGKRLKSESIGGRLV